MLTAPGDDGPGDATEDAADDAADPDRPVGIDVGRFEPRTLTPGATVRVTGTLTNPGGATISELAIRLQRGEVMTTRAELAAHATDPDPAGSVLPAFTELPGELAPGGELDFEYAIPAADLQISADGVYPVLINVNGTVDGEERRRVGELATFVIEQSVLPPTRTTVGWLWPITERTHRDAAGAFVDDRLADLVSEGGRLDRALSVVERLPATSEAAGGEPPTGTVTLAVDPALVEELTVMAAGPYAVDGVADAGAGTEAAVDFLDRLGAVAGVHPVVALPYGDVDLDALDTAALPGVLVRSLPSSPGPTADQGEGEDAGEQDATGAGPTGEEQSTGDQPAGGRTADGGTPAEPTGEGTGTGDGGEAGAATGPSVGARILVDALGVQPRTEIAWPAGGVVRPVTLAALRDAGMDRAVLSSEAVTGGADAVGLTGGTSSVGARAGAPGGPVDVLVADAALAAVAGSAETAPGGPRLAEQRYLAELALITLQAPAGSAPGVLVAPPRDVDAGPEGAAAMMADSTGLPWLRPGSLDEFLAAAPVDAGQVDEPRDAVLLDPAGLTDVVAAVDLRDGLAGAVSGDAGTALQPFDAATSRATSVAWRDEPDAFRAAARDLRATITGLRGRVSLLSPADGTYTLGSSDAPLVLTVENDLAFAVQVRLAVQVRGNRGLSLGDVGVQTLAPGERRTLQVPAQVQQSGGFAVSATLTTPDGAPLGERIDLQVRSTAYGPISLLITIGAAALLALLFLRRLVLFVLRRRRRAASTPPPGGHGPADATRPPARSPV